MRISKVDSEARNQYVLDLFLTKPELSGAAANDLLEEKFPKLGRMRHAALYEIRDRAHIQLKKEGKTLENKPKRGRPRKEVKEIAFMANRDITLLPSPTVVAPVEAKPETSKEEAAVLVKIDNQTQGSWLGSVLEQLSGRGLASCKVVYKGPSHVLVAGEIFR